MLAEIIVDIPVAQVNKPFTYYVPEAMQEAIELGMRVEVPFGHRQLMGYVTALNKEASYDGKLKPISRLLDYQAYLTPELLQLSRHFASYYHCFEISMLQAMLPSLLKVKYSVVFKVEDPLAFKEKTGLEVEEEIERERLEETLPLSQIKALLDQDILSIRYRLEDQKSKKTQTVLILEHNQAYYEEQLEQLPANYHRQRDVLTYLIEHLPEKRFLLKTLQEAIGSPRSVIKRAEEMNWLTMQEESVYRDPLEDLDITETEPRTLTPIQEAAFSTIREGLKESQAHTYLLEGVTGSGKTEVYLQLIAETVKKGKSAILLVPEIALTPQMVNRVVGRFKEGVAVLHSGLSVAERYDEWRRILAGDAQIVVGARSSIFAPLTNIGLIIIDEEQETSYKQGDNPRYHARDIALWRANFHQCPLVLGSATPSLESRSRAEVGNYTLVKMNERINQRPLPPVEFIDMRTEVPGTLDLSKPLLDKICDRLSKKEQIILLLNRRGYANYLLCRECGYVAECPRCDIALTYHKFDQKMKCHYCDYEEEVIHECPQCGSSHIRPHGSGTQKVMEQLEEQFPDARILRMDYDTTRTKGAHQRLLTQFEQQEADILLGTQMIAKGLDFERVSLVGVINADTALNLPDFRAGEKTFQLLTQVAGRTGRGALEGEVVIQTFNPEHYVMHFTQTHNYEGFFYTEMQRRHLGHYPPYYYTILLTVASKKRQRAQQKIYQIKHEFSRLEDFKKGELLLLGPSQSSIAKINDYYRYQLLLKFKDPQAIDPLLDQILDASQAESKKGLYVNIDREPLYFT